MYAKCWLVIRDDAKRTFEVCGQASSDNAFTNNVYGMQKAKMNVSCITPPVGSKYPHKETIKIIGYTQEEGLHKRLLDQYKKITFESIDDY